MLTQLQPHFLPLARVAADVGWEIQGAPLLSSFKRASGTRAFIESDIIMPLGQTYHIAFAKMFDKNEERTPFSSSILLEVGLSYYLYLWSVFVTGICSLILYPRISDISTPWRQGFALPCHKDVWILLKLEGNRGVSYAGTLEHGRGGVLPQIAWDVLEYSMILSLKKGS
ncbi:hypothetical protein HOY82DRAFT_548117 [Tuber indicum]|nr:hypothetical protein HOY82DRAFT_548117 [Tuber indicum]